jgi:hypothetical protein
MSAYKLSGHQIGTYKTWKFGLISREVYRISENLFEINDTSSGWVSATVGKRTMEKLISGEKSLLDLKWK